MQGKGFIKVVAIALAMACLYHISFTWVASNVEKNAKAYSKGDSTKENYYLDSIANEPVLNLGIAKFTYKECKEKQLNLGLDLKGGMNVTMEVSMSELIRSMSANSSDTDFNKALELAKERAAKSGSTDFVALFGAAYKEVAPAGNLANIFATPENKAIITPNSTNEQVLSALTIESGSAFERSFEILRTRIDKFGVTQPNIQKIGGNRILIELPGVDDPERVRKLLQGSAKLEFWETYDNRDVYASLVAADAALAIKLASTEKAAPATSTSTSTAVAVDTAKKSDLALLNKIKSGDSTKTAPAQSAEFAAMSKKSPLFAVLTPSIYGDQNGQQQLAPGAVIGHAAVKDTALINQYLSYPEVRSAFPANMKLAWDLKSIKGRNNVETGIFSLYALKATGRDGSAAMGGNVIASARADFDQISGKPEVVMIMNGEASKEWERITTVVANRPAGEPSRAVAIVLDDVVYTAPGVNAPIAGGISSISGNFTLEETQDLANVLKAGKLPAPAKIVEEATVGPTLGAEAISAGLISCLAGLAIVFVFMGLYYNKAGLAADVALIFNLFLIVGVLASFGAVLTLTGIAGIVLNIGMAVDANVLIYERIKEELDRGKSFADSIRDGFSHAYSAIIDANVTILLLGIILYVFSSGLIQGFATTLIIGIFTSLFSSIFITRLIFEGILAKKKTIKFSNEFTKNWFKDTNFDFVAKRKTFYVISALIILAGGVSMATKGLTFGVDFQGGRTYTVRFDKDVKVADVRDALTPIFDGQAPEVKTFGGSNQVRITTAYEVNNSSSGIDQEVETKLLSGVSGIDPANKAQVMDSRKVGPTIANDIRKSAFYSIGLALLVIFIYIRFRFGSAKFGIGAVVSLLHDVLIILSIYSIFSGLLPFSLDVDQTFVASILTIMGYSMNDTVVVFDRVREYMSSAKNKQQSMGVIINNALNSTLNRTVITGLCTMLVLIVLFIFGGEMLRGFSFTLLIGVVVGTYSSLFVATPIVVDLIRKEKDQPATEDPAKDAVAELAHKH